jgi:hypothetical protein
MKANIKAIPPTLWKLYKLAAFSLGTLLFLYIITAFFLLSGKEEMHSVVVPLRSGFVYHYDMKDGSLNGHHLRDQKGRVVIHSDVIHFVEDGTTIYGYRKDIEGNPFYFICTYGEDCLHSQHLNDAELRSIVEARNLNLYTSSSGTHKKELLRLATRNLQKTGSRPEGWGYVKEIREYRIREVTEKVSQ